MSHFSRSSLLAVILLYMASFSVYAKNTIIENSSTTAKPIYNISLQSVIPPLTSTGYVSVIYKIQNNMSISLLGNVMKPVTGIRQDVPTPPITGYCGYSKVENGTHPDRFDLGAKGSANDSCLLQLTIVGSLIPEGVLHEPLIICGAPYVNCTKGPNIDVNPPITPAIITVEPTGTRRLFPNQAVIWRVTNSGPGIAYQIKATATGVEGEIDDFVYTSNCEALDTFQICDISTTVREHIVEKEGTVFFQGSNTNTVTSNVELQTDGLITVEPDINFDEPTSGSSPAKCVTVTNIATTAGPSATINSFTLLPAISGVTIEPSLCTGATLSPGDTCDICMSALVTAYGSGQLTVTYNTTEMAQASVAVDLTTLEISQPIILPQSGSTNPTILNTGKFNWSGALVSIEDISSGVSISTETCSAGVSPGATCTVNLDAAASATSTELIASTTDTTPNTDLAKAPITVISPFPSSLSIDITGTHLQYTQFTITNTGSVLVPSGWSLTLDPTLPGKVYICSANDPTCVYPQTCSVGDAIPVAGSCQIWVKSSAAPNQNLGPVTGALTFNFTTPSFVKVFNVEQEVALYATGLFNKADTVDLGNIAKWNGSTWSPLLGSFDLIGRAGKALEIFKGDLYVGGAFISADGVPNTSNLAIWNGSQWKATGLKRVAACSANNATVQSLRTNSDGDLLYIGGNFDCIKSLFTSSDAQHIAQWDGTTLSPLAGAPKAVRNGINSTSVYAMVTRNASSLDVGGDFTRATPTPSSGAPNFIASWNPSATMWSTFRYGMGGGLFPFGEGPVYDMAYDNITQRLYVVGRFLTGRNGSLPFFDEETLNNVGYWDGSEWRALESIDFWDTGVTGPADSITLHQGKVYIGGPFDRAGGVLGFFRLLNHVAYFTGNAWKQVGNGLGVYGDGDVLSLRSYTDTAHGPLLYAGGQFIGSNNSNTNIKNIAYWNGVNWQALNKGLYISPFIFDNGSNVNDILITSSLKVTPV